MMKRKDAFISEKKNISSILFSCTRNQTAIWDGAWPVASFGSFESVPADSSPIATRGGPLSWTARLDSGKKKVELEENQRKTTSSLFPFPNTKRNRDTTWRPRFFAYFIELDDQVAIDRLCMNY